MEGELDASSAGEARALSYRQRLEKLAGGDVVLMKWSPTMDLLAATFADNTVIVNRLSWQRVWSIPAEQGRPTSLAWRPDGTVLAVGRSDGRVSLLSVEGGRTLHTHTFAHPITSLHWMVQVEPSAQPDHVPYMDRSLSFLPPLPSLESSDPVEPVNSQQILPLSKEVDILLAGDEVGVVHVCVGGVLCATDVKVGAGGGQEESHVTITCLSGDLRLLSAVGLTRDLQQLKATLHLKTVEVDLIRERHRELRYLALHYSQICRLLDYASATLRCMHEAWEDILLMVDTKLAQYSTTLNEGASVADELLVLLACGRARPELRDFLLDELTAKGVKKIGLSLETSYTRVRKYSLTCLCSVVQALQFHLGEVLGMARWREMFGNLGISTDKLQICLNSVGTFALKNQELQLVIDESLKSMKAFFTWIYVVILKLGEESIPPNVDQHLNAEELKLVIHFLRQRLAKSTAGGTQSFNLELVGQYLVDEDLKIVEEKHVSFWEKLVQEAELDSKAIPWLISRWSEKSLLQLLNSLIEDISAAFAASKETICKTFVPQPDTTLLQSTTISESESSKLSSKVGELVCEGERCVYFPFDRDLILLVRANGSQRIKSCRFGIRDVPGLSDQEKSEEALNLLSVQVYNGETLSVLFEYSSSERDDVPFSAVAQLPVKLVLNLATDSFGEQDFNCSESQDVGSLLTQVHSLGPFHTVSMAVSGPRHLAAVFSRRTKKVRMFDVDAEDEEEEEEG